MTKENDTTEKKPSGVSSTSKSSIAEAEEVEVPDILAAQIEKLKDVSVSK